MREASQEVKDWKTVRLPASNLKNCPHVEPARRVQPAGMTFNGGFNPPIDWPIRLEMGGLNPVRIQAAMHDRVRRSFSSGTAEFGNLRRARKP